ncbi:unnamed protein product [Closterium sp. NIES-53]
MFLDDEGVWRGGATRDGRAWKGCKGASRQQHQQQRHPVSTIAVSPITTPVPWSMRMPLCSALKQRLQLVAGLECSRERSGATGTDEIQRSCMLQQVGQQRGQAGQIRSKEGGGHTGTKEQTGARCEGAAWQKETAGAAASGVGSSSATTRQALNSPRSSATALLSSAALLDNRIDSPVLHLCLTFFALPSSQPSHLSL